MININILMSLISFFNIQRDSTNSIGLKVDTSVIIDKYPFMISRCKAKYISD